MTPELDALLVDDRAGLRREPLPLEERAVVAAGEEARLLALGALGDRQAGRRRLVPGAALPLPAERERNAVEQRRIDRREHVRLILGGVAAAGDQPDPGSLDDARVVAGPEDVGTGPRGEGDEDVEAERSVAAHARVRRQALRVALDERLDDLGAELLAQIERDVRQPEPVAGLARGDDGVGRAAGALGARAGRVEPEAERDADRVRGRAQQGHGAVDAAAHRDRDPAGPVRGREHGRDRVRERVGGERLAGHGRGLEQREADERPLEAGRVGSDDPVALDGQPDRGVLGAARGVADQLERRHAVRLPAGRPRALRGRAGAYGRPSRAAGVRR